MDARPQPQMTFRRLIGFPPAYVAQSPWGVVPAILATVAVCLVSIAAFGLGLAIIGLATGATESEMDAIAGRMMAADQPEGVAAMIGSQLASLLAVWALAGWKGMRREVLRLHPPKPPWGLAIALGLAMVALSGVMELILYSVARDDPFADSKWLTDGLHSPYWWGVFVIAVVLAPLWEELTFRGFLLSALAQTRLGFWGAAGISNAAWTLLHANYSVAGLVSVFGAGLMLSWLVWRTGSIRAPVVAHAVFNFSAVLFSAGFAPQA